MRILVTGGAGFIGSNIANTLVKAEQLEDLLQANSKRAIPLIRNNIESNRSYSVIALDDLSLGANHNLSKDVQFVNGSVMNYNLVSELTKDCDYIFHQAALSSSPMFVDDPRHGLDVNIMGFMNVMEAAKRNKVKRVIYASSSSVYSGLPTPYSESDYVRPRTFYESSFYCREIMAQTYYLECELDSIGLRYFSVYGPNERHKGRFANNISQFIWDMAEKRKSPVIYGDGSQTRDFTFVEDVVQANILAMNEGKRQQQETKLLPLDNKNYGSWNNNYSHDDNEAHTTRSKRERNDSGPTLNVYNVGTGVRTSFSRIVEIINNQLGTDIKPTYVENPVKNYVHDTMADISLARSDLGYEPKWKNVEDGIRHMLKSTFVGY